MSKFRNSKFFSLFLLAIATGACAKKAPPVPPGVEPEAQHSRQVTGPVTEVVRQLGESTILDECDLQQLPRRLALARALDARSEEIKAYTQSLSQKSQSRTFHWGPMVLDEDRPEDYTQATPGWREHENKWEDLLRLFDGIRDKPVDGQWLVLDQAVRGVLFDDQRRALYGMNVYLDRHSGAPLEAAVSEVEKCTSDKDCSQGAWPEATEKFFRSNPYYRWYLSELSAATETSARRKLLERLDARLKADLYFYQFKTNPTVRRKGEGTFEMDLVAGPFEGFEAEFAELIEKMWRDDSHQVRVRWVRKIDLPEAFRLVLRTEGSGRPYVSWYEREVNLFPLVTFRGIAHEIGHVLGFPDRYYTTWLPETCSYRVVANTLDLMSIHFSGEVRPEDWQELARRYPLKPVLPAP